MPLSSLLEPPPQPIRINGRKIINLVYEGIFPSLKAESSNLSGLLNSGKAIIITDTFQHAGAFGCCIDNPHGFRTRLRDQGDVVVEIPINVSALRAVRQVSANNRSSVTRH